MVTISNLDHLSVKLTVKTVSLIRIFFGFCQINGAYLKIKSCKIITEAKLDFPQQFYYNLICFKITFIKYISYTTNNNKNINNQ